jgi:hypothetical protein
MYPADWTLNQSLAFEHGLVENAGDETVRRPYTSITLCSSSVRLRKHCTLSHRLRDFVALRLHLVQIRPTANPGQKAATQGN